MTDWLSEIEGLDYPDDMCCVVTVGDAKRMSRVLREFSRHISHYTYFEAMDEFSDDAKELCVAARESSREE